MCFVISKIIIVYLRIGSWRKKNDKELAFTGEKQNAELKFNNYLSFVKYI
ncbi:hypothetical protein HMPREF9151_01891 [Hoylesella saccharolytica F0055]|uniref:Uncharacterized protein n=1 Tax=Hoylesella saccharolytica F0055 TaxID=1127699 RepID=L1N6D8_9BACT|nr:hypothetical protein HMPREF9151_01891 [Hoylesella saccharolytica F0055]